MESSDMLEWINERFKERLISRKCEVKRAPHLPDSIHQMFICEGYVKDNVHCNPLTSGELKTAIRAKIMEIRKRKCVRVIDTFAQF